jgi:hypothetical protein
VSHAEISNKNLKELNYFSDLYDAHPFSWYRSQFDNDTPGLIKGEFSVTYLTHPLAAERIKKHFPDIKILAIVKNPTKRAFSNYLHSIRKGDISPNLEFSEYIKKESNLEPGKYVVYLRKYFELFPKENILVLILDEFTKDIPTGMVKIFQFIGTQDPRFISPKVNQRNNEARSYKFLWIENILVQIYRFLSRRGYTRLVKSILDSGIGSVIRKLNGSQSPLAKIDVKSKQYLDAFYEPYNQELEKLLERDLSLWGKNND